MFFLYSYACVICEGQYTNPYMELNRVQTSGQALQRYDEARIAIASAGFSLEIEPRRRLAKINELRTYCDQQFGEATHKDWTIKQTPWRKWGYVDEISDGHIEIRIERRNMRATPYNGGKPLCEIYIQRRIVGDEPYEEAVSPHWNQVTVTETTVSSEGPFVGFENERPSLKLTDVDGHYWRSVEEYIDFFTQHEA